MSAILKSLCKRLTEIRDGSTQDKLLWRRWVNEPSSLTPWRAADGKLLYDEFRDNGAKDFDDWRLTHSRTMRQGLAIDAIIKEGNTIVVTTSSAARLTIWLHPRMVDINKRVKVFVDGKLRFHDKVKPSLLTALKSYLRRKDWGLVYPIMIEMDS